MASGVSTMAGVPEVEWEQFWDERGGGPEAGAHVSVYGPTGSGKTYALISLLERFPGHSILIVTKARDRVVQRLIRERGWVLSRDPDDILSPAGQPGKILRRTFSDWWGKRDRPLQRIVYHPKVSGNLTARADELAPLVETMLARAYAYGERGLGRLAVGIDETMFAAMELGAGRSLVVMWNESRSMEVSLLAAMQRPVWIPASASSSPTYQLVFPTSNPKDLRTLSEMAGYDGWRDFKADLDGLGPHQHLLIVGQGGAAREVYRSRVVIRKRGEALGDGR